MKEIDNGFILKQIDYYRKKNGWTKYELIQQTGLSNGIIYEWYNKGIVPSLKNIQILCDAFDIGLSEFFATTKEEQLGAYEDELFKICALMNDSQRESVLLIAKTLVKQA